MYRALRRGAGRYVNAFPALKRALRRIERVLMPGFLATPEQPMPVPGPTREVVRAPVFERVLGDLDRERRRRRACGPPIR